MAKILELVAKLSADKSGFDKAMKGASDSASRLKTALAGAFASIGISALIRDTVTYAGAIADVADRFGVLPEKLQEMQYWATQNAASVEDLTAAFDGLEKSRKAAIETGDAGKLAAFGRMGISKDMLQTMDMASMMSSINKSAITRGQSASKLDLMEIFGKSASKLTFAMQNSIEQAGNAARESGAIIKNELIFELARVDDAASSLSMTLKASLAPAIMQIISLIERVVVSARGAGSFLGGATGGGSVQAGARAIVADRERAAKLSKEHPVIGAAAKYLGVNFISENAAALAAGISTAFKAGSGESEKVFTGFESDIVARSKSLADKIAETGRAQTAPPITGSGLFGGAVKDKQSTKNTIDSDAFAKIGGFVGGGGALNYQREASDGIRSMVRLFQGPGGFIRIKDTST